MKWISVKNKLPEYTTHAGSDVFVHVLVYGKNLGVCQGMYCNEKWEALSIDCTEYITHWMPMPTPPKKNNGK